MFVQLHQLIFGFREQDFFAVPFFLYLVEPEETGLAPLAVVRDHRPRHDTSQCQYGTDDGRVQGIPFLFCQEARRAASLTATSSAMFSASSGLPAMAAIWASVRDTG